MIQLIRHSGVVNMKGICDALKSLYHHCGGLGICGGGRTGSNRNYQYDTVMLSNIGVLLYEGDFILYYYSCLPNYLLQIINCLTIF